jgi:hypothetical protein
MKLKRVNLGTEAVLETQLWDKACGALKNQAFCSAALLNSLSDLASPIVGT